MLIIKAKGGLGNRLLSAASAISYARATNREWCIDWRDGLYAGEHENSIELMFDVPKQDKLYALENNALVIPRLWSNRIHWPVRSIISLLFSKQHSNPFVYRKLSAPFQLSAPESTAEIFWSYTSKYGRIKQFLSNEQRTVGRDRILGEVLLTYLKPNKRIIKQADSMLAGKAENTLGVHIRYTDLKVPIASVVKKVKEQLSIFQYHYIYLATDSADAQMQFSREFSNVLVQEKRYSLNNAQLHSVRDYDEKQSDADAALIDLITLSKCKGLVYCSRSTFAETSRLYGDFDKERLVDVDRFNVLVSIKRWLQERL